MDNAILILSIYIFERDFPGFGMWSVLVMQSEQHWIYRLRAGRGGGHKLTWIKLIKTALSGSSRQLTLKKGAPGDQV